MVKVYQKEKDESTYWKQSNEAEKKGWPYIVIRGRKISCDWITLPDIDLSSFRQKFMLLRDVEGVCKSGFYRGRGSDFFLSVRRQDIAEKIANLIAKYADEALQNMGE